MIRILHLTNFVGKRSFGIGPVVLGLASSQQALGHNVTIYSLDTESEARELEAAYHLLVGTIQTFPIVGPSRLAYSPRMEQYLLSHAAYYDVVHAHGIWMYTSRIVNRWRARQGGPTVVAPHGSLDAWVLRRSRWKKRVALLLYERENLHRASCMHALSQREAEGFRDFGLGNPIAIIPNGIFESWLTSVGDAIRFRSKFCLRAETRVMFFLSRITPKKGLPMLLQAMASLRQYLGNWKLVIAGVNEFGHQPELEALVHKLDLQRYVQFVGPLYGQDKRDAFAAAELFVLPSHSEGAPVVILEALGAGVPVLTTKASPWEELITHRCGWWTEISQDAIANALRDALQHSQANLRAMGSRGKELIRSRYTWASIAEMTIEVYRWLLKRGERPSFVIV
ncbi:MAG: glycosyltransferase [Candidatus Hadarchaeum sp.]|uniref:glycosyltransferase n=1 Tax=Candidatus Hadarchaeum sp. TaxID=2883567 RepID=UPI00317AE693